jgi:hypothetical protein
LLLKPLQGINMSAAFDAHDQIKHAAADLIFVVVEGALLQIDGYRAMIAEAQLGGLRQVRIRLAQERAGRLAHQRSKISFWAVFRHHSPSIFTPTMLGDQTGFAEENQN